MASPLWVILSLMASMSPESKIAKLPRACLPEHYELKVDLSDADAVIPEVKGSVQIRINCVADTLNITLNWKRVFIVEEDVFLAIFDEKRLMLNKNTIKITGINYQPEQDFLVVSFGQTLKKGSKYILNINFRKTLGLEPTGLYKSYYFDSTEESMDWLVLTNLYPMNARSVFPCYDEPDLKATFNLSLIYSSYYNAISNIKLVENDCVGYTSEEYTCRKFSSQLPIAPYQLAFSVNDYDELEETDYSYPVIEGLTKTNFEEITIAVNYTATLLDYYCELLGVEYPAEKLTLVTIGSMSWEFSGGIGLLGVPDMINDIDQITQRLARGILRHILTDRMTLSSWSDLWILEGLTWYFGLEVLKEKSSVEIDRCWEFARYETLNSTLPILTTSSETTLPIIDELGLRAFCLLSTMSNFIGKSIFLQGSQTIIENVQNKIIDFNTFATNFKSSDIKISDLDKLFRNWSSIIGSSIVNISRTGDTSSQYQISAGFINQSNSCIPLRLDLNDNSFMVNCTKPTLITSTTMPINFTKLYQFKFLYDSQTYELIAKELSGPNNISIANRVRLLHDVLELAWMGSINYTVALNVASYLRNETEYRPWRAAFFHFERIWYLLRAENRTKDMDQYIRKLMSPVYQKLGVFKIFNKLPSDTQKLHSLLARWACRVNADNCTIMARSLIKNGKNIPNVLQEAIIGEVMVSANDSDWNMTPGLNRSATMAQKQLAMVKALKIAAPHELTAIFMSPVMRNLSTMALPLEDVLYYSTSVDVLLSIFGKASKSTKRNLVRSMSERIVTEDEYEILLRVIKFLDGNTVDTIFNEALDIVRSNLMWLKTRNEDFSNAIKRFKA